MRKPNKNPEVPKITVKLVKNVKVLNPSSARRLVLNEETLVPDAPYWHRRIAEGVVERVTEKKTPEKKPEKNAQ